ncbi:MAG: hypothetical protein RIT27_100 [Pseudomonadota bacterium]|jgi:hypothetical protein
MANGLDLNVPLGSNGLENGQTISTGSISYGDPLPGNDYGYDPSDLTFSGVLISALVYVFKTISNILFTKGIILAALLFFVDFIITFFLELLADVLKMSELTDMISRLPFSDFLQYLLYLGAIDYGLPLLLSAYLLKFFIRRIPFVG